MAAATALGLRAIECVLPGPAGEALPPRGLRLRTGVRPVAVADAPAAFAPRRALTARGAASRDPAVRDAAAAALIARADAAAEAGIPLVVCPPADVEIPDREGLRRRLAQAEASGDVAALAGAREALATARANAAVGALDGWCRTLHAVTRARPDHEFALAGAADLREAPLRDEVPLLLADVRSPRVGYWHDCAAAAALAATGGPPPDSWLGALAASCVGIALSDHGGGEVWLPPGAGATDWAALRGNLPRGAVRVLRVDPRVPPDALRAAVRCLSAAGLA